MLSTRARIIAAATAAALTVGALAAPAFAVDPPELEWSTVPGSTQTADGVTIWFETALAERDPWGIGSNVDYAEPVPMIRAQIVNDSAEPRAFSGGISMVEQGTPDPLWLPSTWYVNTDVEGYDPTMGRQFTVTLQPGESLQENATGMFLAYPIPIWPGRDYAIYQLTAEPTDEAPEPPATELGRYVADGRFIPLNFVLEDTERPVTVGKELEVAGTGATSELFPGVSATVEASGLTSGEQLEVWLARDFDYFFFFLLGGGLPEDAIKIGEGTVAPDGTFSTTFDVAPDTPQGSYQVIAGVPGERYWPAGSFRSFTIAEPQASEEFVTPLGASSETLTFEYTEINLGFSNVTQEGTTSVAVSTTGPSPDSFSFAWNPPLYYHLNTTAELNGDVEVCITYDTTIIPGDPPSLYHLAETQPGQLTWRDITVSQAPGVVCGLTDSFSPFTLGYPDEPVHDGSTVAPAKGTLSHNNGWDTGLHDGDFTVSMNLWWGENASQVRLYEAVGADAALIATTDLTRATPAAQNATFEIAGKANGSYTYYAVLSNSTGETTASPITVKVKDANPGKPVLSDDNWDKNGAYLVTANMWWGTNATSYTFRENGTVVGSGSLTVATPGAQQATLSVLGKVKGTYVYTVTFTNAAGETTSASKTVKVTK